MPSCLTTPSHYMNQYWHITQVLWHSSEGNIMGKSVKNSFPEIRLIDLGQHWLRWWLVAWHLQAITWTDVDFSLVRFCGIYLRTISQRVPLFCVMSFKINGLVQERRLSCTNPSKLYFQHLPGANELTDLYSILCFMRHTSTMVSAMAEWPRSVLYFQDFGPHVATWTEALGHDTHFSAFYLTNSACVQRIILERVPGWFRTLFGHFLVAWLSSNLIICMAFYFRMAWWNYSLK